MPGMQQQASPRDGRASLARTMTQDGGPADPVRGKLADAADDAARVAKLAARYCRSDLLAVSLGRRALDHRALAQALRAAGRADERSHLGGSFTGALRRRWLQLLLMTGLLREADVVRVCADADRRLLVALDRALGTEPSPVLACRMKRHQARIRLQLPATAHPRPQPRMRGA